MSYSFYKLNAESAISATDQCLEHVDPLLEDPQHSLIISVVNRVMADRDTAVQSLSKKREGEKTEALKDGDSQVDDSYVLFIDTLDTASRRTGRKSQSEAANIVLPVIETHGRSIHRLSRQKQVGAMEGVITHCEKPAIREAITAAGADYDYEAFKTDFVSFKELLKESAEMEAIKGDVLSPTKARKLLTGSLSDLYSFVEILAESNHEQYVEIHKKMNETLDKFRG